MANQGRGEQVVSKAKQIGDDLTRALRRGKGVVDR